MTMAKTVARKIRMKQIWFPTLQFFLVRSFPTLYSLKLRILCKRKLKKKLIIISILKMNKRNPITILTKKKQAGS